MMTSLIGFLILVSALTATSSALWCTECSSLTSLTCSGKSITCPSGTVCGSIYRKIYYFEAKGTTVQLHRDCRPSTECNFNGTMSLKHNQITMGISCCNTDNCTPTLPTLPIISPNHTGLMCPSCLSRNFASCYPSDAIQCTGDENMCLLMTEIAGRNSAVIRGCTTKSYCDLGSLSYTERRVAFKRTFKCTSGIISGGISAHKVVLTPTVVCLLLLKLFL